MPLFTSSSRGLDLKNLVLFTSLLKTPLKRDYYTTSIVGRYSSIIPNDLLAQLIAPPSECNDIFATHTVLENNNGTEGSYVFIT